MFEPLFTIGELVRTCAQSVNAPSAHQPHANVQTVYLHIAELETRLSQALPQLRYYIHDGAAINVTKIKYTYVFGYSEHLLHQFAQWLQAEQRATSLGLAPRFSAYLDYLASLDRPLINNPAPNQPLSLHFAFTPDVQQSELAWLKQLTRASEQLYATVQHCRAQIEQRWSTIQSVERLKQIAIRGRMALLTANIMAEAQRCQAQSPTLTSFIEFLWRFVEINNIDGWYRDLINHEEDLGMLCDFDWEYDTLVGPLPAHIATIPPHIRAMVCEALDIGLADLHSTVQRYSIESYTHLVHGLVCQARADGSSVDFAPFEQSPLSTYGGWGEPRPREWFIAHLR